jgi:hypothetical protein
MTGGWTGDAGALLDRAVGRHGGWAAWNALRSLTLTMRQLSGLLPSLKGLRRTFPQPGRADVFPHQSRAVFHDYPTPGQRGIFDAGAVQIVDGDGAIVASSPERRRNFGGLGKWRRWSPADALYFFGYAVTHYHSLPCRLDGARRAPVARLHDRAGSGRRT